VIYAWNADGEPLRQWTAHADAVAAMKVDRAGKVLLTAGADKLVRTWSLPDGKELAKFEGHVAQVMAVAFSPDGKQIASAGADKEVKVWDLATRDQAVALVSNLAGVTDLTWLDDKRILSSAEDGTVRVTSVEAKDRAERTFSDAGDVLYAVAVDKGGTVYAACHDGSIYVYSNNKLEAKLP
jgi:WD40 repeat protein